MKWLNFRTKFHHENVAVGLPNLRRRAAVRERVKFSIKDLSCGSIGTIHGVNLLTDFLETAPRYKCIVKANRKNVVVTATCLDDGAVYTYTYRSLRSARTAFRHYQKLHTLRNSDGACRK